MTVGAISLLLWLAEEYIHENNENIRNNPHRCCAPDSLVRRLTGGGVGVSKLGEPSQSLLQSLHVRSFSARLCEPCQTGSSIFQGDWGREFESRLLAQCAGE